MFYRFVRPLLFRLDPERAHELAGRLLRFAVGVPGVARLGHALYGYNDPLLRVDVAGLRWANPIGLAAGFDKRAALLGPMALLGLGHIEVGTVTPRPQPGNQPPRLFRLAEDRALINRLGFNSPGMAAVAGNLRAYRQSLGDCSLPYAAASLSGVQPPLIIGANIGKNRATPLARASEDYLAVFAALAPFADYVAINISSPNTPGLRKLHERDALEALLRELTLLNGKLPRPRPLFLKVSPDESPAQIEDVVQAGCEAGISGFIATNTTIARAGLHSALAYETGGLSGWPLAQAARQTVAQIYRLMAGSLPIIGVGGIASAEEAYARIRAGASLVQVYTGLIYEGPGLIAAIKRGLAARLRRDGYRNVAEAVGADV